LAEQVAERVAAYRARNGVPAGMPVPVDAVTASASGLDPHISVANARLQAPRVAAARDVEVDRVLALIDAHTDAPSLGFLGGRAVDVLELNLALDRLPSAG
ncbi:MAG: potassium-transporting ATPase subunit C, partial [Acidimicrobiia bacterium]